MTIRVSQAGIYIEVSQEAVKVSHVGAYLEVGGEAVRFSHAGAYIETTDKQLRVEAVGAYLEIIEVANPHTTKPKKKGPKQTPVDFSMIGGYTPIHHLRI